MLTLKALNKCDKYNLDFTQSKLCLATATHNFVWVKTTEICLIRDQTFENLDSERPISFRISSG